jgi:flagellar secretion chaperone FliS
MQHVSHSKATAHYRTLELQSQVECANPHSLVAMLYEELLLCIDVLTLRACNGDPLIDDEQAHRARSIILSLRSGLDIDGGGALATMLDGLYAALASELEERLATPDPLRFSELKAGVESLASAWAAIVE